MDTATVQQPVFLPLDSVELIFLMIKVNVHVSKLLKMYPENSEHFQFSISVPFFSICTMSDTFHGLSFLYSLPHLILTMYRYHVHFTDAVLKLGEVRTDACACLSLVSSLCLFS